ncbi:MAG: hypothetical protein IT236_01640 [Bacteroidia bacterium]|nr:hypothetical protein [Bacteroidia bacterium]
MKLNLISMAIMASAVSVDKTALRQVIIKNNTDHLNPLFLIPSRMLRKSLLKKETTNQSITITGSTEAPNGRQKQNSVGKKINNR